MINQLQIKSSIVDFVTNQKETDPEKAIEKYAEFLSNLIKDSIQSATITVPAGIPVATAGSATNQVGTTTAPATATIL